MYLEASLIYVNQQETGNNQNCPFMIASMNKVCRERALYSRRSAAQRLWAFPQHPSTWILLKWPPHCSSMFWRRSGPHNLATHSGEGVRSFVQRAAQVLASARVCRCPTQECAVSLAVLATKGSRHISEIVSAVTAISNAAVASKDTCLDTHQILSNKTYHDQLLKAAFLATVQTLDNHVKHSMQWDLILSIAILMLFTPEQQHTVLRALLYKHFVWFRGWWSL